MSLATQIAVASVKHLLAIEDQRVRQLNAIHRAVQADLEGPYYAALDCLREAGAPGVPEASSANHLRLAEERFIDALGNFEKTEPLQRAWSGVYLSGICQIQDRRFEACRRAVRAHEDAIEAVRRECELANDGIDGKISKRLRLARPETITPLGGLVLVAGGTTFAAGLIALPVTVAAGGAVFAYRKHRAGRSRTRLEELSAFVDEVADLARSLGAADVAGHVLSYKDDGLYVLEPTDQR